MRFFIVEDNSVVLEKRALEGSDEKINIIIDEFRKENPKLVVIETDEASFNSTQKIELETSDQKNWKLEKQKGTAQAIDFIAKQLRLE